MIELVTEQTNLYGNRDSNDPDFETNPAEIRRFIGILLLTGYHAQCATRGPLLEQQP